MQSTLGFSKMVNRILSQKSFLSICFKMTLDSLSLTIQYGSKIRNNTTSFSTQMESIIKEAGLRGRGAEREFLFTKTGVFLWATSNWEKKTGSEESSAIMEALIWGVSSREEKTATGRR